MDDNNDLDCTVTGDERAELDTLKARLTKLEMAVANLQRDIDNQNKPVYEEAFTDSTLYDHRD